MPLFRRRQHSRSELSARAARAQAKGKFKKALSLYLELLRVSPEDPELHRKIGPLLARTGQNEQAWRSFRLTSEALAHQGFHDKALGVYRQAAHYLPRHVEIWIAISELYTEQNRPSDAVAALLEGRSKLRSRRTRAEAIRLLAMAHGLVPDRFDVGFDLARLRYKTGDRDAAWQLWEKLSRISTTAQLRRVCRAQLVACPTPRTLWRWLRAWIRAR
jgi:tetratricopeptide (TPR) repeat protein